MSSSDRSRTRPICRFGHRVGRDRVNRLLLRSGTMHGGDPRSSRLLTGHCLTRCETMSDTGRCELRGRRTLLVLPTLRFSPAHVVSLSQAPPDTVIAAKGIAMPNQTQRHPAHKERGDTVLGCYGDIVWRWRMTIDGAPGCQRDSEHRSPNPLSRLFLG